MGKSGTDQFEIPNEPDRCMGQVDSSRTIDGHSVNFATLPGKDDGSKSETIVSVR